MTSGLSSLRRLYLFKGSNTLRKFICTNDATDTNIMRILNVAEKNDAARSLSEIMSGGRYRRREGLSVYNKIYEYDYQIFNRRNKMVMTSVSGHLLNLDFAGNYRKWTACNPLTLFHAPVVFECLEEHKKIKETLEKEVRSANVLIIWTDGDREGENIGFEIIEVCRKVKSDIQVFRARFSEITAHAITQACQNLAQPKKEISDAVNVRRELDLRIGASFTRFQTLRLKKVFPQFLENQLISYGSCQFPTLGFVVERYKQVQAFIPEPFWKIKVLHTKGDTNAQFSWERGRLFDHTACLVLYQLCLEAPTATVIDLKSKHKNKWRPLPLDTVELEKLASRKLKINAKEAMKIAEKLYTQGYISYPRTETNIFPKGLHLMPLVEMQANDPTWGAFANRVLTEGPNPRQGNKTDNAHPPIHPTKYTNSLQGNEKRLYEFVVRHFLACVSKDAEGKETSIEIDINGEKFSVSGLMITARNYLDVYPYDKWNTKVVPEYTLGETFQPSSVEMVDGETSPPPLLTEADLIALMEKHGIGTDATHAEHIETIKQRLYVGLNEEQRFVPGQLGMGLVEGYDAMGFEMSKPHLRAELEADLKRICEGSKDPNVVLREQLQKYQEVFTQSLNQANKLDEALSPYLGTAQQFVPDAQEDYSQSVMKCPKCHSSDIVLKHKRDGAGYFLTCMAYPHCNAVIWLPDYVQEVSVSDERCEQCQSGQLKKLHFKFRKASLAPLYPDNYVGCIGGCDRNFLEALGIRPILSSPAMQNTASSLSLSSHFVPLHAATQNHRDRSSLQTTSRQPLRCVASINQFSPNQPVSDDSIDVVCHCGDSAVLLTCRKEGNAGRQFYKCPRPPGNQCKFFMWHESRPSSYASHQADTSTANEVQDEGNVIKCNCQAPAKLLTVAKDGPNQGRQFYTCAKPRERGCNFFKWAVPENPQPSIPSGNHQVTIPSPSSRNGYCLNPSKTGHQSSNGMKRKRKCGICGEEGHNRKSCPQSR